MLLTGMHRVTPNFYVIMQIRFTLYPRLCRPNYLSHTGLSLVHKHTGVGGFEFLSQGHHLWNILKI